MGVVCILRNANHFHNPLPRLLEHNLLKILKSSYEVLQNLDLLPSFALLNMQTLPNLTQFYS